MNTLTDYLCRRHGWRKTTAIIGLPLLVVLIATIRLYQLLVSPLLGPRCKFYPSCSTYGVEALTTHGSCKGSLLAVGRICRCHPWQLGGINPVPPRGRWRAAVDLDGMPLPTQRTCSRKHDLVGV